MIFWTTVKIAVRSLFANKLRTFLAMLGIIIGVGAVISMMALGKGAQNNVLKQISSMGSNLLMIRPAQSRGGGVFSGTRQNLKLDDAEAILQSCNGIRSIAPVVRSNAQMKFMNKNTRSSVIGTAVPYFSARNFVVEKGRQFNDNEGESTSRVAVIGPVTATNLFGEADPLGQTIKINNINFVVIGVLKTKGDQGWFNPDDQAIIPYKTCMKQLMGVDYVSEINVQAMNESVVKSLQTEIENLLRKRHRLLPEAENDFNVQNQAEFLNTMTSVTGVFSLFLSGIASISLLVGGIGIMNIMLVTVTERIREIGIRKAIGAKNRDILQQFLIEAMLLSGVGGGIGVVMGLGISYAISKFSTFQPIVEPQSIILALSVSISVGVFFGFYPARRAALLDPIEALRYE